MMPLSFPPLREVVVDGVTRWQATCRTCGQDVARVPQLAKTAADYARREHGHEAECRRGDNYQCPVIGCTAAVTHHHHTQAGVVLVDWCRCEDQA